jgi:DNA-binding HxlR family transcriptional regulator
MSRQKPADALPSRRSDCPIAAALDLVGDKWSLLVIRDIGLFDNHRNKDFQSASEAIPSNILADRLKRMTAYGLLEKRLYQDHPPRYEYHLTRQGRELLPVLRELALWSENNLAGVKIPRAAKEPTVDHDES